MKKMYKYSLILVALASIMACSTDSTNDVSDITNFAVFELEGDSEILLNLGDEYVEPGASATVEGTPVDVTTSSVGLFNGGSLDTNVPDIYTVSYSAFNPDGFEAAATRNVIVADTGNLIDNISGLYVATVVRNGSADPQYAGLEYVLIWENSDGTFELSDGIGGYYHYGRGYGVGYAARGATVTVNGLNDYSFGSTFGVGAFGGVAEMTEMTVDPDAKTIDFVTDWDAGYIFAVHLEQVQF